tara:strand:+ start:1474 stop:1713 length:240 start_codon:yes stop_codon:yes gene_type:complete
MSWWSWINEPYPFIGEHSLPPGWWGKRVYESSYSNWYIYTPYSFKPIMSIHLPKEREGGATPIQWKQDQILAVWKRWGC